MTNTENNVSTKKHVLIAEDDEDDRMLVQSAFLENRADVHIDFALDGLDLMDILTKDTNISSPCFILLDLNMPRKDGREVLKEIKQDLRLKKIPVIVFTTANNETEIRRCYDLGANTYIVKPDSFKQLLEIVVNLSSYWLDVAEIPL
jgi:CheY-like chemotaxis protein